MSPTQSSEKSTQAAIIIAIVVAIGGWGTAAITNWDKIFGGAKAIAPYEDVASLRQVSEVLHENQAANALYADFLKRVDKHTLFSDYFRIWKHLASTKQKLLDRMQELKPTPRFARLHEILSESLQSDVKLMLLEEESLRHTLDYVKELESKTAQSPLDDPKLSEDEKRKKAWEILNQFMIQNKKWLNKAQELEASLQSTRAISSTAIQLLNDELKRLALPYSHEDPFTEKKRPSPSSSDLSRDAGEVDR
jgi:hypothetical protein